MMIKNRWIKKIGIGLVCSIGLLFILSFYISYFLNQRLPKIIEEKNDTAYDFVYKDLSFSIFNSSLSLKDINVSPKDSAFIKDSIKVTGKVKEIDIVGINFFKLITKKEVSAYSINVLQPSVNYYLNDSKRKKDEDRTRVKVGDSFDISNVNIRNGEFNLFSNSGSKRIANVSNYNINFDGVQFNKRTKTKKIPFKYAGFDLKLDSMFFVIEDKQLVKAKKVLFNTTDFELTAFTMKPLKMNGKNYVPNESDTNLFDISSPLLSLTKMDWGFTEEDKFYFNTDLIHFAKPTITIISTDKAKNNKRFNSKDINIKTDDAELVNVKKLQIDNGKIKTLFSDAQTTKYAVKNANLSIEYVKMNHLTQTSDIPVDYKNFQLKLDSMYYRIDQKHVMTASYLDLRRKKIILKNFKIKPTHLKEIPNFPIKKSNSLLDIEVPILTVDNNRWELKDNELSLKTNRMSLDRAKVKIKNQGYSNRISKNSLEDKNKFLINFNLDIDTIQIKNSSVESVKKFKLNNVDLTVLGLSNKKRKELVINNVTMNNTRFTLLGQPKKVAQRDNKTAGFNDIIKIKKFTLVNGHFEMIPFEKKSPHLTVHKINLKFDDIDVNSKTITSEIPFTYHSIFLKSSAIEYDLGKLYRLKTSELKFHNGKLSLANLNLIPKKTRKQHTASLKKQEDLYSVHIKSISGSGIKWGILPTKKIFFKSDFIRVNNLDANIYRNLEPPEDNGNKSMFSEKLRRLNLDLGIKELHLVNSKLSYEEEKKESSTAGKLTFTEINTKIRNINSGLNKKTLPDVVVDWRSKFMQGNLYANWRFNPMDKSEKFKIKGDITNLPARNMDPFLKPYLKVSVDGKLNKVVFDFLGNKDKASGVVGIDYKDLKVNILREDGSKRKFLSAIGNAVVKSSSKGKINNNKVENISRKQDKSFFNFFLACILEGVKKALLII